MGILANVDDFQFGGKDTFQRNVISRLKRIFKVRRHENGTFKFLGFGVQQTKDGIIIHQNLYASSISPIDIKKGRSLGKNDALSKEKTDLKRPTNQMIWGATQT